MQTKDPLNAKTNVYGSKTGYQKTPIGKKNLRHYFFEPYPCPNPSSSKGAKLSASSLSLWMSSPTSIISKKKVFLTKHSMQDTPKRVHTGGFQVCIEVALEWLSMVWGDFGRSNSLLRRFMITCKHQICDQNHPSTHQFGSQYSKPLCIQWRT